MQLSAIFIYLFIFLTNDTLVFYRNSLEQNNKKKIANIYPSRERNKSPKEFADIKTIDFVSLCFLVKSLVGGRTYYFRVVAYSLKSFENSEEIKFPVPARVKHKAITAGVVGGLLFFVVAIILSVCAVKICNKRKRRKHEKGE